MNRLLASTALLLTSLAHAQNLVPNPSFEEYTTCPDFYGQWNRCINWISPGLIFSADYFNACDGSGPAGVPSNAAGFQQAQDGQAYMGVFTYKTNSQYREFIAVQLTQALVVNTPVRLCFRTSPGGFGNDQSSSPQYTTKGIGMRFFTSSPTFHFYNGDEPFFNNAALYLNQVLTDTLDWTTVSGIYVPDSAYQWLAIGNFFADSLILPTRIDSLFGGENGACVFIDNVSVSYDLSYCGSVGIEEHARSIIVHTENPFGDKLHIVLGARSRAEVEFELWDSMGRQILERSFPAGDQVFELNTEFLPSGPTLLTGRAGEQPFSPIRLVHLSP